MKRSLSLVCAGALALLPQVSAAHITPHEWQKSRAEGEAFRWTPSSKAAGADWKMKASGASKRAKLVNEADNSLELSEKASYLDMPDGTTWFVTADFDKTVIAQNEYYTQYDITGVKATIYNDSYKKVGKLEFNIDKPEGAGICTEVQFAPCVTKKFFNTNDAYELMVMANFTPEGGYGSIPYTYVYSLKGAETPAEHVSTIKGYYVAAVNNPADAWSEDFFLEFLTGEDYTDTELLYNFDIYGKASYSSPTAEKLQSISVDMMHVMSDGENEGMPVLINSKGRDLYVTVAKYEKTFFEDPFDMFNDNLSEDNHYLIDLYHKGGSDKTPTKVSTTSIPCDSPAEGYNMRSYSLGMFSGIGDLTFDFTANQDPAFIITIADSTFNDESAESYSVYSPDGSVLKSFGAGNFGYVMLSDIEGQPSQYCFLMPVNDESLEFAFYDYPSMTRSASIPVTLDREGQIITLSLAIDRVAEGRDYTYVAAATNGVAKEDGNPMHPVARFNSQGEFLGFDMLDGGDRVNLISPYIAAQAMSPYLFNTDETREYMMFVKRLLDGEGTKARTELLVVNTLGETLLQIPFGMTDTGINVALVNLASNPAIWITHTSADDGTTHSEFVSLPLNKFEGAGTAADPYLIKTRGDFERIAFNLNKHFRLAEDLDYAGAQLKGVKGVFAGSLDGDAHTISNFSLEDESIFTMVGQGGRSDCAIKNLTLRNVMVINTNSILAESSTNIRLENIRVINAIVMGSDGDEFGTIVGNAGIGTEISTCAVNAQLMLPLTTSVGGIAGTLGNDSKISASYFTGDIYGASEIGGIAGYSFATASITDCQAEADICGGHTIGGIVGRSARSDIRRCIFDGELSAEQPKNVWSDYRNCYMPEYNVGGIVGELASKTVEYDQNGNPKEPDPNLPVVIQNCVAAIRDFYVVEDPDIPASSVRDNLTATCHRIVGRTSVNNGPSVVGEEYDEQTGEWITQWGDPAPVEDKITDNYAYCPNDLIDGTVQPGAASVEGESKNLSDLDQTFFESLGYTFGGDSTDAPWTMPDNSLPQLFSAWGVTHFINFIEDNVSAKADSEFESMLTLHHITFDECELESSDDDNCYVKDVELMHLDDGATEIAILTVYVVNPGDYTLTATCGEAKAILHILATSGVENVAVETLMSYDQRTVRAEGCSLKLFSLQGMAVAEGRDALSVEGLHPGVYVAVATDSAGNARTLKINVR